MFERSRSMRLSTRVRNKLILSPKNTFIIINKENNKGKIVKLKNAFLPFIYKLKLSKKVKKK